MTQIPTTRPLPERPFLRAEIVASGLSEGDRTVPLLWTTGAAVRRWRWDERTGGIVEFDERLSVDPGAVRLDFLNSGRAPYLDAHDSTSNDSVLGVVEAGSVAIDSSAQSGTARVRFDTTELAGRRLESVRGGILRNVSVGYNVHTFKETRAADPKRGIVQELTAIDWEPIEVSQVPIGADRGASTLRLAREYLAATGTPEILPMTDETKMSEPALDRSALLLEGARAESVRLAEIGTASRALRLPDNDPAVVEVRSNPAIDLAAARERLIAAAARRDQSTSTSSARGVSVGVEGSEKRGEAISSALLVRAFPDRFKLADGAGDFMGRSLLYLAEEGLRERGINTRGLSTSRVLELALRRSEGASSVRSEAGQLTSSDFPLILADVANKTLRMGYDSALRTFPIWARRVTLSDFKAAKRLQLSGGLALAKVVEGGEFTYGKTHEARESYALETFGRIVSMSRQMLINDDLAAFTRIAAIYGAAAADLESDTVYGLLGNNAAMADGIPVFHADHANLGTAGAPAVATLGEARKLLRLQTDLDGVRILNLQGRYLIAGAALETTVDQLTTQTTPATSANVTPDFVRTLVPVIEPRLDGYSATAWYLAADGSRVDTVEYAYLAGEEGVQTEMRTGFEVDGIEIKARLDFAAAVIDHRGLIKNAG